jgi:heat shock protein HtpX
MANIYTHQDQNIFKTWILMVVFLGLVSGIGFLFSEVYGQPTILYFFLFFSIAMNIVSYWFSDRIVLSLSGAKEAKREEYFDLYTSVENLAITAGLPNPRVFVINDPAPTIDCFRWCHP